MTALVGYPIAIPDTPTAYRGQPFDWKLALQNDTGVAIDLTTYGDTWDADLRISQDASTSVPFTIDDSNAADGYLVISLSGEQTQAMQVGPLLYGFDVRVSGGAIDPLYVWSGHLTVDGNYTRG